MQALTGNIPSSGVGVEQPKDVRMDKPIGEMAHGFVMVREAVEGNACACVLGRKTALGSSQPDPVCHISGDSIQTAQSTVGARRAKGTQSHPHLPSLFTVCSPGKGKSHTWATVPWCFVSLWFGLGFHPAHTQCVCHELSSNISDPQAVGMLEED